MKDFHSLMYNISEKIRNAVFPSLRYSQNLYEDLIKGHVNKDTEWLDLGTGHQILPEWRQEQEKKIVSNSKSIVGIDYDLPSLRKHGTITDLVRGDINALPFKDNCFSLITSNMVLEHVEYPERVFNEVQRTLLPGGEFIFHTPNVYGYNTVAARLIPESMKAVLVKFLHGRAEDDIFLTHYRSNNEKRILTLAQKANLKVNKDEVYSIYTAINGFSAFCFC